MKTDVQLGSECGQGMLRGIQDGIKEGIETGAMDVVDNMIHFYAGMLATLCGGISAEIGAAAMVVLLDAIKAQIIEIDRTKTKH